MTASSAEDQPDIEALGAVQGTVQRMLNHVIGPQENASTSKNTFLSEAIPLSNIVPEKVKNQIWANEFINFSLLLKSNISNTDDDQYTIKFETKKGGQPSVVLAPNAKRNTLHSIDQWTSAFQIYVAIYTERVPKDTPALMKYGSVIRELATLGANWKFYDEDSLRSKRFCAVLKQRITGRLMERLKKGGGGREGRKRLQTNPWILKTAHTHTEMPCCHKLTN